MGKTDKRRPSFISEEEYGLRDKKWRYGLTDAEEERLQELIDGRCE